MIEILNQLPPWALTAYLVITALITAFVVVLKVVAPLTKATWDNVLLGWLQKVLKVLKRDKSPKGDE